MSRAGPSCRANISPLLRRRDFRVLGRLHSGWATASLPRLFPILCPYNRSPFFPSLKITRQRQLRFDVRFLFLARSQSQVTNTSSLPHLRISFRVRRSLFGRSAFGLSVLRKIHICDAALVRFGRDLLSLTSVCIDPRSGFWSVIISPFVVL